MVALQMHPRLPRAAKLVGALVLLLAIVACDRVITVKGVVRDPAGKPLANVAVTLQALSRGPHKAVTALDGTYDVGIVGADPSTTKVYFEKASFERVERQLWAVSEYVIDVTLPSKR